MIRDFTNIIHCRRLLPNMMQMLKNKCTYCHLLLVWQQKSMVEFFLTLFFFVLSRGQRNKRKGYMGHLTNVANSSVHSVEKGKNKAALDATFSGEY